MEFNKGDRVTIIRNNKPIKITTIDKVNKVSFNAGGYTFKLDSGYERSKNMWHFTRCVPFEQEHQDTIIKSNRKKSVRDKLLELKDDIDTGKLSEEAIEKLHQLLCENNNV